MFGSFLLEPLNDNAHDALVLDLHDREAEPVRDDAFALVGNRSRVLERENVEPVLNSVVTELRFDKKLTAVVTRDRQGNERELAVDGLFVAVGRTPENQNFAQLIALDSAGYAIAGEDCRTKTAGIFVAGDNRTKDVRQLVTATADGAVAAAGAIRYINEN